MSSRNIRRKYGQNYLKDPAILFDMGDAISPQEFDSFIEIGPGLGALTNQINKKNINIIAVDIDAKNIELLKNKFKKPANFIFKEQDILEYKIDEHHINLRIIGNLPYNISSQIILKLMNDVEKIKIGTFFNSEILFDVPPDAFDIKPKVNSSFIRMLPKQDLDYGLEIKEELYKIVDLAFSSRRKNIKNNLKSLNIDWESLNIDPRKRSEEISLNNFIKITKDQKK